MKLLLHHRQIESFFLSFIPNLGVSYESNNARADPHRFPGTCSRPKDAYRYDNRGNKIETDLDYSENFDVTSAPQKTIYKYDSLGNIVETSYRYADVSIPPASTVSRYEDFDASGNWLKATNYQNGNVTDMVDRKLEYYP